MIYCHMSDSCSPMQRFVLTDAEGTLVSAVVYANNIKSFDDLLMPFKRYYVSNAKVKVVADTYKIGSYPYSWTIKSKTPVEEIIEPVPPMLPCPIELIKFKDLFKYAETEIVQNVMGIVVHVFPLKAGKNQTRDIVIVNEEKICMLLTLWNDNCKHEGSQLASTIASGNVIVAMRIKVTTFNNLSLSTQINQIASAILINPPLPQVITLKQWYKENKAIITTNLSSVVYKNPDFLLPPPDEQYIIDVHSAVNVLKDNKTAWVKGRLKLVDPHRSPWYTACGNCKKMLKLD